MDEQEMDEIYHIQIKDEKMMWMKIGKNENKKNVTHPQQIQQ
jgi:hypothetical protein